MKYIIKNIFPGQIQVEFENGSLALVPISSQQTKEEIDYEVSKYDPDFILQSKNLVNQNIQIGEERQSSSEEPLREFTTNAENLGVTYGMPPPLDVIVLADYYAERGDTRLKDVLFSKIEKLIAEPHFSLDTMIADMEKFEYRPEEILKQSDLALSNKILELVNQNSST